MCMTNKDNFKKKIIYRSTHRGTKEMDLLLGSFVNKNINSLNIEELKNLHDLMNYDDEILFDFYYMKNYDQIKNDSKILNLFKNHKL